ncbi:hypothetical protein [uncultured Draconibacterium sp.]|uniref:hypothetical protein n=1 Tax=uncultured Draconibacterium sp. TaxID=1573823 RepID=UPI0025E15414|nr:hypothetical protein [uncultured Draconibacterium sp.]
MGKKGEESYLEVYPAWAWSLLTFFLSIILLFIVSGFHDFFEIVAYTSYIILIAIACFFICRAHPESVWYTPVICNLLAIISILVFVFREFETLSELMFWVSNFVVSVVGAIVGAKIGRRKSNKAE